MNLIEKFNSSKNADMGNIIDESFNIFKKIYLIYGLAYFILIVVLGLVFGICFSFIGDGIRSAEDITAFSLKLESDFTYIVIQSLVSVFLTALFTPLSAGILNINHLARNNYEFSLGNIFDFYKNKYTSSLITVGVVTSLVAAIIGMLFILIKLPLIGNIVVYLFAAMFYFTVPLIIYDNATPMQAIEYSIKLFGKHPAHVILLALLSIIIAILGIFGLCIGIFFTFGYVETMRYSIYRNVMPMENQNEIEEIGTLND